MKDVEILDLAPILIALFILLPIADAKSTAWNFALEDYKKLSKCITLKLC